MKGDKEPRAKSGRERQASETRRQLAKSDIMKGDKLGRQGGSGSQERNYKGRPGGISAISNPAIEK